MLGCRSPISARSRRCSRRPSPGPTFWRTSTDVRPRAMRQLTYAEAVSAIQARGRFGIRLGLGRVRAMLRALGDPQLEFRGALIGGTNGKGSVLALAASALRAGGCRVGETP